MTDAPKPPAAAKRPAPNPPTPPGPTVRRSRPLEASPALMVFGGLTVVCLIAAVLALLYAPPWLKARNRPPVPPPAALTAPAVSADAQALRDRIAQLEAELAAARLASSGGGGGSAEVAALTLRLDRIEADQSRIARAASAAIAAAALADAAQSSRPFAGELALVERLSAAPPSRSLRRLAETGAPTRASLSAAFPQAAARAAVASRAPDMNAGPLTRALHALSAVVTLRRVAGITGGSPDAVLARAEREVADGDLDGAIEQIRTLPRPGQDALADWRNNAERRLAVEREVARLRTGALAELAGRATITAAIEGSPQ